MNNKKEPIKDFLYNSVDFLLIIVIVAAVIGVISWRINIMFDSSHDELVEDRVDESKDLSKKEISNEKPIDNIDKSAEDGGSKSQEKTTDTESGGKNAQDQEESIGKSQIKDKKEIKIVDFTIPQGAVSTDIAQLLKDARLVRDADEFISKCEEMKLSTSLKSGDFEIPSNASIEEILNIITK